MQDSVLLRPAVRHWEKVQQRNSLQWWFQHCTQGNANRQLAQLLAMTEALGVLTPAQEMERLRAKHCLQWWVDRYTTRDAAVRRKKEAVRAVESLRKRARLAQWRLAAAGRRQLLGRAKEGFRRNPNPVYL